MMENASRAKHLLEFYMPEFLGFGLPLISGYFHFIKTNWMDNLIVHQKPMLLLSDPLWNSYSSCDIGLELNNEYAGGYKGSK